MAYMEQIKENGHNSFKKSKKRYKQLRHRSFRRRMKQDIEFEPRHNRYKGWFL